MAKSFEIGCDLSASLSVEDIWPDGDAPENPTAADVVERIESGWRSIDNFIRDWNMAAGHAVTVDGEVALRA